MAHKPGQARFHKLRHGRGQTGSGPRIGTRRKQRPSIKSKRDLEAEAPRANEKPEAPARNRPSTKRFSAPKAKSVYNRGKPKKRTRTDEAFLQQQRQEKRDEDVDAERDTDVMRGDWQENADGNEGGNEESMLDEAEIGAAEDDEQLNSGGAPTEDAEGEARTTLGLPPQEPLPAGHIPKVAIVGRPNVGKSSLFNRIVGSRISIEDPLPGTTRDRVSTLRRIRVGGEERVIELFDTAGIGIVDEFKVEEHVHEQIEYGIAGADVVIFVTDSKEGPQPLDIRAGEMLRRTGKPIVVAANKADADTQDNQATSFFELGLGEPLPISAKQGRNLQALMEAVGERLPPKSSAEVIERPEMMLAIIGRRNAGKSSLVNALATSNRVIVSEIEGTTRDSVDVRFGYGGKTFVAIDTAGVRRRQSLANSVEFFSQSRSFRAIRRAHVVVLLVDAREPISKIERDLVEAVLREHKPLILAVNKWDLVEKTPTEKFQKYFKRKLGKVDYAPLVFLSAKTGLNVFPLVDIAQELHDQAGIRLGTGELNRIIKDAYDRHNPQPRKAKLGRMFYSTQVSTDPPTIVVFVNDPELFPLNWRQYLLRQLQETTPFAEVPIKLVFRAREHVVLNYDGK